MPSSLDIVARMAAEIAELPAGARVAGEAAVMRRFGVGRAAARAALQELEHRLLVRRVQGSGTFVNRPLEYVISHAGISWHETVTAAGGRPRSAVRDLRVLPLPDAPAARLDLAPGTPAHRVHRQYWVDDVLARCSEDWVPVDVVGELAVGLSVVGSVDLVLRELGRVDPLRAWSRVSLDVPAPAAVALLELSSAVPLWLVESVHRDGPVGRAIRYSRTWIRADAVRLTVELGAG